MSSISIDNDKAYNLYNKIIHEVDKEKIKNISLIMVQHLVPNTIPLIDTMSNLFKSVIIIPKPKSINPSILSYIEHKRNSNIKVLHAKRQDTSISRYFEERISRYIGNSEFIIADVGGYFSDSFSEIYSLSEGRLIGVIEDTENGHQKYMESLEILTKKERNTPILSVARSPLKEPEDFLVGQSIVYSVERIMRDNNSLLINKRALVIGYGKIGKSIANSLSSKNMTVWVYDIDPIRRAQALSHGYYTPERDYALQRVDLIISATGNKSLKFSIDKEDCDFFLLKNDCFIASVTSCDDEFDFGQISKFVNTRSDGNGLETHIWENQKSFYVLNSGNAVNFAHNNTLGPYIYIVASEIVSCLKEVLTDRRLAMDLSQINELTNDQRKEIATLWMGEFLETRSQVK